jgi:hypothetical protein
LNLPTLDSFGKEIFPMFLQNDSYLKKWRERTFEAKSGVFVRPKNEGKQRVFPCTLMVENTKTFDFYRNVSDLT